MQRIHEENMSIKRNKGMIIIIGLLLLAVGVFYVSPAMAQDAQTVERLRVESDPVRRFEGA